METTTKRRRRRDNQTEKEVISSKTTFFSFLTKHPQLLILIVSFIIGLFIPQKEYKNIPPQYLQLWGVVVFAMACFFPFVIKAISSRQASGSTLFIKIIQFISHVSFFIGIGLFTSSFFSFKFLNIGFLCYGLGGYTGLLFIKLLSKKTNK